MKISNRFWEQLRVPTAALLALGIVIVGIFLALTLASRTPDGGTSDHTSLSDAEKLHILASLEATSSTGLQQKEEMLKTFSTSATNTPSEQQKLQILESLHAK